MDRNTVTGLLLIGAILIGYSLWMQQTTEPETPAAQSQQTEQEAPEAEEPAAVFTQADTVLNDSAQRDSAQTMASVQRFGQFHSAARGQVATHTLQTSELKLTLSNKGAAPIAAELINYHNADSTPLLLFDSLSSSLSFKFWESNNLEINSAELFFEPIAEQMTTSSAVYRLYNAPRTGYLQVTYATTDTSAFGISCKIEAVDLPNVVAASDELFELHWQAAAPRHEQGREQEQNTSTIFYQYLGGESDYISERDYEKIDLTADVNWVAFKQQYFSAALVARSPFSVEGAEVETIENTDERYTKTMRTSLGIPLASNTFEFGLYLGPNHYQTLNNLNLGLEDQINLGWGIFGWVNRWMVIPTFNLLDEYTGLSYGIIILVLTLLIKIVLFPLNWRSYLSSARMRVLKPEADAINEKMKDKDPLAKQQAVMTMYRQAGVNPMAGCIPMLLQLPILYAMFQFFPASIELRQEPFLWATDLSTYDSIFSWQTHIPLLSTWYGNHISLFTILMAISTFFYSKYNMDMAGGTANAQMPQMKVMIYIMPFMLLFFFNSYSAGLSYYYFAANMLSMAQQWVIKKFFINEADILKRIQDNKKKPVKKSSFQERLEKMAKERGLQTPKR